MAAIGTVEGTIAETPRGGEGFGYDPVFVPDEGDGRTFAEMTPEEKNHLSHRGRAFRTLADGLRVVELGRWVERIEMAVIDIAGFVADLKDHAVEHGFHVHDERHFVESYSLRQNWEVDLHPEEGCEGPVDLYLSLEIDPRVLLGFEDAVIERADLEDPPDDFHFPLNFTWALPPLPHGPDLLVLATELAAQGRARPPPRGVGDRLDPRGDRRARALAAHRRAPVGLAPQHPRRRRRLLRRARPLPRREPLPPRPSRRLARLTRRRTPSHRPKWGPCRCGWTASTTRAGRTRTARSCGSAGSTSRPRRRGDAPTTAPGTRADSWTPAGRCGSLEKGYDVPEPEPEGEDVAALLDEAEDIVNAAVPDIMRDLGPKKRGRFGRRKRK